MMKILNIIFLFFLFGCTNSAPETKEISTVKPGSQTHIQKEIEEKKDSRIIKDSVESNNKTFRKELKSDAVTFNVYNVENQLKITTKGFEIINDSFIYKIDGKVTGAELGDLNKDGFPELYVFYSSDKDNRVGDIIALGSNRNKSVTPIYVRHPAKNHIAMKGYSGNDRFFIKDNKLVREFTVENNEIPKKTINYKLIRGETSLILQME